MFFRILVLFNLLLVTSTISLATNVVDSEIDSVLLTEVNKFLPSDEKLDASVLENSNFETVTFEEDTELWGRYIWEQSGGQHSFGYYSQDVNGSLSHETVLFNTGDESSGGILTTGDYFKIGDFSKGDEIGFFLSGNGYKEGGGNAGSSNHIYYSETSLNKDGIDHVVSAKSTSSGELVIGFEQTYKGGDQDYNDVVFSLFSTNRVSLLNSVSSEISIDGRQTLNTAVGNVTMNVAMFAKLQLPEDILLINRDQNFGDNVVFSGVSQIHVESNCGVIISVTSTPISNGTYTFDTSTKLDGVTYPIYTQAAKTHNNSHLLEVFSVLDTYTQAESGTYTGLLTVTLSAY